jgi:hypothetical protein
MSTQPSNDTFKRQQVHLVRSAFKKGFINAVHVSSNTVDVYYAENPQSVIKNIPVADTVTVSLITVGKKCRIDIFDETNPSDCVLAFTY